MQVLTGGQCGAGEVDKPIAVSFAFPRIRKCLHDPRLGTGDIVCWQCGCGPDAGRWVVPAKAREHFGDALGNSRGWRAEKHGGGHPGREICDLMALNAVVMHLSSAAPTAVGEFQHAGPDPCS